MRVQEVLLENNNKRYILLDQKGFPVISVMKYLKYIDTTGKVLIPKEHTVIP